MTKVVAVQQIDLIDWDLTGVSDADIVSAGPTQFVIDDTIDDQTFTFTGKNFTYDAHGVISGTLNTLAVETAGEPSFTFSGMKVDIVALRTAVHNVDLTAAENLLFGGADSMRGSAFDDGLRGMGGDDTISGGKGDDTIMGDAGSDQLTGGKGADVFGYVSLSDSNSDAADTITDLETRDRIDISTIDANVNKSGDQAFKLVAEFSHHAGEAVLTYDAGADRTSLQLDVNGDGVADGLIYLDGDQTGFHHFVL